MRAVSRASSADIFRHRARRFCTPFGIASHKSIIGRRGISGISFKRKVLTPSKYDNQADETP